VFCLIFCFVVLCVCFVNDEYNISLFCVLVVGGRVNGLLLPVILLSFLSVSSIPSVSSFQHGVPYGDYNVTLEVYPDGVVPVVDFVVPQIERNDFLKNVFVQLSGDGHVLSGNFTGVFLKDTFMKGRFHVVLSGRGEGLLSLGLETVD